MSPRVQFSHHSNQQSPCKESHTSFTAPGYAALQDAVAVLSAACATHGYTDLASALTQLLAATRATAHSLLASFCRALADALFPRYSAWVLSQAGALLLLPGAGPQHGAVVQLLQALFEIPGLQLSPEARRLVTELGVLNPVVVMTQVRGLLARGAVPWACCCGWVRHGRVEGRRRGCGPVTACCVVCSRRSMLNMHTDSCLR